ncbi:hypothetical protein J6590_106780, partial [Homalodisca vitripennis]
NSCAVHIDIVRLDIALEQIQLSLSSALYTCSYLFTTLSAFQNSCAVHIDIVRLDIALEQIQLSLSSALYTCS